MRTGIKKSAIIFLGKMFCYRDGLTLSQPRGLVHTSDYSRRNHQGAVALSTSCLCKESATVEMA
jgi:hypothetical protein